MFGIRRNMSRGMWKGGRCPKFISRILAKIEIPIAAYPIFHFRASIGCAVLSFLGPSGPPFSTIPPFKRATFYNFAISVPRTGGPILQLFRLGAPPVVFTVPPFVPLSRQMRRPPPFNGARRFRHSPSSSLYPYFFNRYAILLFYHFGLPLNRIPRFPVTRTIFRQRHFGLAILFIDPSSFRQLPRGAVSTYLVEFRRHDMWAGGPGSQSSWAAF